MRWPIGLGLLVLPIAVPAHAEPFDNASVIALTRAGLESQVIVAKVAALPCGYDLSTAGLLALRQAGVAQPVMVEMLHRCTGAARAQGMDGPAADSPGRQAPGLYLAQGARLVLLRPAASVGTKVTGNGSLLFPHRTTLTVARPHAEVAIGEPQPHFLFVFDPADAKVNTFGTAITEGAQSPGEFSLVQFRSDGNTRQLVIGRGHPLTEVVGIDPKIALPFAISEEGDGTFRVRPEANLAPGEYGFVVIGYTPRNRVVYRIYDFTVVPRDGVR